MAGLVNTCYVVSLFLILHTANAIASYGVTILLEIVNVLCFALIVLGVHSVNESVIVLC